MNERCHIFKNLKWNSLTRILLRDHADTVYEEREYSHLLVYKIQQHEHWGMKKDRS